jgi:putative PIN family toxin of toxin-antitoxin system
MRRAVFDANILINAFLNRSGGLTHELPALARNGEFDLVLSSAIIIEAWRKLISAEHIRTEYTYSDERAYRFCRGLHRIAKTVLRRTRSLTGIVRDADDDKVLACALDAQADTIVTRDKDLLSIGVYQGISIITPEVFRQQLRDIVQSG